MLWLLCGCTISQSGRNIEPSGFVEEYHLAPGFKVEKVCYNAMEHVAYLWETNTDQIHIFQNDKLVNTIGGRGFERGNFQKLSDICLSPDGNLIALDSFDRSLKKFDKTGNLVTEIKIDKNLNPSLAAMSLDEKIYIYDGKSKEILVLDNRGKEKESFGSLQFNEISSLELYQDILSLYDKEQNITLFYSRYGQLLDEHEGHCFMERDQIYILKDYFLEHLPDKEKFAVHTRSWQNIFYQSPEIILYDGEKIAIGKMKYAQN